ncbi:hypothetical protein SCORR_v1c06950 [Spiroplasma corruscae]|uniref:Transmembrane protein n=1 Tax=Spiroplasma corruscae TaxID=216934 RepID=A0A222EPL7_9MOLU|nr:hypothetical protein [Spiroplasma corruscae]ASP28467.1 hypothetical protein SCORR_v1c06950 [Spiroplasma corruscae]
MKKNDLSLKQLITAKEIIIPGFLIFIVFNLLIFLLDNIYLSKLTTYLDLIILISSFVIAIRKINFKERKINLLIINLLIFTIIVFTISLIIGIKIKNIINLSNQFKVTELKNYIKNNKLYFKSIKNNFILNNFALSVIFLIFNFFALYINSYKIIVTWLHKIYLINLFILNIIWKKLILLLTLFLFSTENICKKTITVIYKTLFKTYKILFKNKVAFNLIRLNTYNKWSVTP